MSLKHQKKNQQNTEKAQKMNINKRLIMISVGLAADQDQ